MCLAGSRRELHLLELVQVAAAFHPAPVDRPRHGRRGQVDGELAALAEHAIGKAGRADGDGAHRRIGANDAGPGHGEDVLRAAVFPAADQHRRNGVQHGPGFPQQFFRVHEHEPSALHSSTAALGAQSARRRRRLFFSPDLLFVRMFPAPDPRMERPGEGDQQQERDKRPVLQAQEQFPQGSFGRATVIHEDILPAAAGKGKSGFLTLAPSKSEPHSPVSGDHDIE